MSALWVAFYSVRGGVGRSTTLVLTALDLARRGHRVAAVDFDLESPGLDVLLAPEDSAARDQSLPGVVDFLDARLAGRKLDVEEMILPLDLPGDHKGRLFLVPAGRCDSGYLAALDRLDLRQMYERSGLLNPVRALRAELEDTLDPDVVLIDSRTGYSDAALVTLFDLADAVVVVMVPDLQNVLRLEPVLKRLGKAPRKPAIVLVGNKIQMSTPALRAVADIEARLRDMVSEEQDGDGDEEERPFLHKLPFESTLTWAQRLLPPPPVLSDARERLGERIHWMVEDKKAPPVLAPRAPQVAQELTSDRERHLARLSFGEDTADAADGLLDTFVFSAAVIDALRPERWLVRGRKGAGLTSLYRMLTEQPDESARHCPELGHWRVIPAHSATATSRRYLDIRKLLSTFRELSTDSPKWKDFWRMYAVAQAVCAFPALGSTTGLRAEAAQLVRAHPSDVPKQLDKLLGVESHLWIEEMQELTRRGGPGLLFIYDDLVASLQDERRLYWLRPFARLIEAWTEDIQPSPRLLPKILLPDEVFDLIPKGSRWRARDVELRWDFADLAECLTRRACQDDAIRAYVAEHARELQDVPSDARSFVVLFDERVGPKGKYARTWLAVKNRLADAGGNLVPRDFVRLGGYALSLEKQDRDAPRSFKPALIAGKHTLDALTKVSEQRVRDLHAEFPEDTQMLASLRGLRSPADRDDLLARFISALPAELDPDGKNRLAEGMLNILKRHGVIGDWTDGRLFVPDLYLHGLGMSRANPLVV